MIISFTDALSVADPSESVADLQARIDSLGYLQLGRGTYDLGSVGLVVNGVGKSIVGIGDESLLVYSGSDVAIAVGQSGASDARLWNFKLQGTANTGRGIEIGGVNSSQTKCSYITIRDFDIGLNLKASQICQFRDMWITSCGDGVVVGKDADYQTATLLDHLRINANTRCGIKVNSAVGLELIGNVIETNGFEGLLLETDRDTPGYSIADTVIERNYFEQNNYQRGPGFAEVASATVGQHNAGTLRTVVRDNVWGPLFDSSFHWSFCPAGVGLDSYYWHKNRLFLPIFENPEKSMMLERYQIAKAAAPTSGYHFLGEIVWNRAPSYGNEKGWVCTAAGTPGTWAGMGPL